MSAEGRAVRKVDDEEDKEDLMSTVERSIRERAVDWRLQARKSEAGPDDSRAQDGGPKVQRLRRVLRRALWFSRQREEE